LAVALNFYRKVLYLADFVAAVNFIIGYCGAGNQMLNEKKACIGLGGYCKSVSQ
jgi:hypothetical protein